MTVLNGDKVTVRYKNNSRVDTLDEFMARVDMGEDVGCASFDVDAYRDRKELVGLDFSEARLRGADFSGFSLVNCKFSQAKLGYANFDDCSIIGSTFQGADLTNASFIESSLTSVDFSQAWLTDTVFDNAVLQAVGFNESKLLRTRFPGCDWEGIAVDGVMPGTLYLLPSVCEGDRSWRIAFDDKSFTSIDDARDHFKQMFDIGLYSYLDRELLDYTLGLFRLAISKS